MIQEILNQSTGELFKMALSIIGITCLILHILPKSEKKSGFFGFIQEIMKFFKAKNEKTNYYSPFRYHHVICPFSRATRPNARYKFKSNLDDFTKF